MGRLILVSNRLPVQVRRTGRKHVIAPSAGGLVSGLMPVHQQGDGLWLGTLGGPAGETIRDELVQERLIALNLPREAAARAYEGYSNNVLWPLFHYLLAQVTYDRRDWDAYHEVNELFAEAVVAHYKPGDHIWIHDYHLMLLPRLLRERLPDAVIGFFLHIPFPSSEVFRILPRKEAILRGLLGANLIGLHTYDYARHLATSYRRVSGLEFDDDWRAENAERTRLGVFPLGVDVQRLARESSTPEVEDRLARLRKEVGERKVILGVDRMDYTKGLPLRLEAFRRALELDPELKHMAVLIQLVVPSRSNIPSYRELKDHVERLVGEVNGLYSHGAWTPIVYLYRAVPTEELLAMYRLADVMLVTPVRDGMNLVAKEYVATRTDHTGVLVLSEFAGAASEMGEAFSCNPWDTDATAETLVRAMREGRDESTRRMRALRRRCEQNDVHRWVHRFRQMLGEAAQLVGPAENDDTHWQPALFTAFAMRQKALVALDYDGTLAEITQAPDDASPSVPVRALLQVLGSLPEVEVAIVSGRDAETMARWLDDLPVHLIAEHGYLCRLRGESEWLQVMRGVDLSWKASVREVLEEYAARAPGVVIEDKKSSLAWHYRMVEPAFGSWLGRELAQHLVETFAQNPLEVHHGKRVVEVRPYGINKGRGYKLLENRLGPFDFILAAGDDRTDEDLFAALPTGAWSVKVGSGQTRAHYRVPTPAALRGLLDQLCRVKGA